MDALIRCEALRVGYEGRPLLPPIDLEIRPGEFWAVLGRNGSGKTTWFRTLLGLLAPVGGQVRRAPGLPVAYVAQRRSFDDLVPVSVEEVVTMGRLRRGRLRAGRADREAAAAALTEVGAEALRDRTFRSLSEGQKQRVLLARMLATDARVALLDEPTAAMDAVAEAESMALIDHLRRSHGLAVLIVSHHLEVARRVADHAVFLDDEQACVVVGPMDEVWRHPAFAHRYGARGA